MAVVRNKSTVSRSACSTNVRNDSESCWQAEVAGDDSDGRMLGIGGMGMIRSGEMDVTSASIR